MDDNLKSVLGSKPFIALIAFPIAILMAYLIIKVIVNDITERCN